MERCVVRTWRDADASALARHADDRRIWINLRDAFPHPYSLEHAERFIASARSKTPPTLFAIEADGEAVGSIGYSPRRDVERLSAEIGYFVGVSHWGRGIATEALRAVTALAAEQHGLMRLFALPFAWNPASCRVLEKAGYTLEARLRRSAIKDGRIVDQFLYAWIRPGRDSPG